MLGCVGHETWRRGSWHHSVRWRRATAIHDLCYLYVVILCSRRVSRRGHVLRVVARRGCRCTRFAPRVNVAVARALSLSCCRVLIRPLLSRKSCSPYAVVLSCCHAHKLLLMRPPSHTSGSITVILMFSCSHTLARPILSCSQPDHVIVLVFHRAL